MADKSAMRSSVVIAVVLGIALTFGSVGSTSNTDVATVARATSFSFKRDNVAIKRALERLNLSSLESVDALLNTGLALEMDMRIHRALLARTTASTASGRAGRSLLLQGVTALVTSGDYMLRYGRALESSAPAGVWQADRDGYLAKTREGKTLARRGSALIGVSFG
jgi:hypothetical protein